MSKRITITLTDDEYRLAKHFAEQEVVPVAIYLTMHAIGGIEADVEGEAYENDLTKETKAWRATLLATLPTVGTA